VSGYSVGDIAAVQEWGMLGRGWRVEGYEIAIAKSILRKPVLTLEEAYEVGCYSLYHSLGNWNDFEKKPGDVV